MKYIRKLLILVVTIVIGISLSSCSVGAKDSDKKLYLGIMNGNLEQVKESLEDGANINKIGGKLLSESNPIRVALKENQHKIADYLIGNGADANYSNNSGYSLLMYSTLNTNVHFSELLLAHGAKIDQKDKDGNTALEYSLQGTSMWSTERKINSLITLLLDHGAKIRPDTLKAAMKACNDRNGNCSYGIVKRILEGLIKSGHKTSLNLLLEAAILGESSKANELIKENKMEKEDEQQILFYTAAFGNVETIKLLEEKGIDIKSIDKFGNTLIATASKYGQLEIVKYLLSKGADIEALNNDKDTPLEEAITNNHYEVAEYLIKKGAKINNGVLDLASENGNVAMMKLIIVNGYTLDYDSKGVALCLSVENNQIEASKYLLTNGADINWDDGHSTSLEDACLDGNLEAVKFLIENGASIDGKDENGDPLNTAAKFGNTEVVEYLIKKGANINKVGVNKDGENVGKKLGSALESAAFSGYLDIVKLLVDNGANLECQNESVGKSTATINAAARGSRNILEYLIQKGAKIDYQNANGKTALMVAVSNGYIDNVRVLLKYNADVSLKDKNGLTALDIAKEKKNKAIIELLESAK